MIHDPIEGFEVEESSTCSLDFFLALENSMNLEVTVLMSLLCN